MRNAFIVRLPMGAGKTRYVLSKILRGTGPRLSAWNRRLSRTLIAGPNHHVHRAWLRELVLLAYERGLARGLEEEDVRNMSLARLRRTLKRIEITIPTYRTYRLLGRQQLGRWHYVVLDEWHRTTEKIIVHCRRWADKETSRRPWYVGGTNVVKDMFFVSATPVNPVLEEEEAVKEDAFDEEAFEHRVTAAIRRAVTILQGFTGRRADVSGLFFEVVARLGLREQPSGAHHWKLPRPVENARPRMTNDELELVRTCVQNDIPWGLEYARVVGLVRTRWDRHRRIHRLSSSLAGRRTSFGKAYGTVHIVSDGRKRPPAWRYLKEQHPRLDRLLGVLEREGVTAPKTGSIELTRSSKALVFCTHRGVALGLVETLKKLLGEDAADTNVDSDDIDALTDGFNNSATGPFILVATDVLSEGIDLHWACKLLVHYELPWSPLRLFQRIGRLTRRKGKVEFNRNVRIAHVIVPGSVEEERVNRLLRRIRFLADQDLWPTAAAPAALARAILGSGPSLHLAEAVR